MDSECVQASSSKSISVPNFRRDFLFTLPGKVPLRQKYQNDVLRGNMNTDVFPYILKFKSFFKNSWSTMAAWNHVGLLQSKSAMIYLPKKFCLIIIHTNTIHILDMSCCHKYQ